MEKLGASRQLPRPVYRILEIMRDRLTPETWVTEIQDKTKRNV